MPNTIFVNSLVNSPMPQTYASGVRVTVLQTLMADRRSANRRIPDGMLLPPIAHSSALCTPGCIWLVFGEKSVY